MKTEECIIIFVKAPVPGFVKTRLARDIGDNDAVFIYKKITEKILNTAQSLGADMEIHCFPEDKIPMIQQWLGAEKKYFPQKGKDLGEKMFNSVSDATKRGYKKVVLMGSDIPAITEKILQKAFKEIKKAPVLGPCEDGGYYLIGADVFSLDISFFSNIPWSKDKVLEKTIKRMKAIGFIPSLLDELNDIDTLEDLNKSGWNNLLSESSEDSAKEEK